MKITETAAHARRMALVAGMSDQELVERAARYAEPTDLEPSINFRPYLLELVTAEQARRAVA